MKCESRCRKSSLTRRLWRGRSGQFRFFREVLVAFTHLRNTYKHGTQSNTIFSTTSNRHRHRVTTATTQIISSATTLLSSIKARSSIISFSAPAMSIVTPKHPTASKKRNDLPPTPDSPWDEEVDECPHSTLQTSQILKDLEREIKTDEWKANAMKNNVFTGSGLRKASNGGNKLESNTRGFSAMSLQQGKRLRLS